MLAVAESRAFPSEIIRTKFEGVQLAAMALEVPSSDAADPPGQAASEVLDDRIWVDGCWDFFHHGADELSPCHITC